MFSGRVSYVVVLIAVALSHTAMAQEHGDNLETFAAETEAGELESTGSWIDCSLLRSSGERLCCGLAKIACQDAGPEAFDYCTTAINARCLKEARTGKPY